MNPYRRAFLASWRMTELALEVGLDPTVAKRLDDLRIEDARVIRPPSVRQLVAGARRMRPKSRPAG